MDIAPKSPETSNRIQQQPKQPSSFTNGVLKRHHHLPPPTVISYKECLKNHAATLGGHALDGCCEFMPSPTSTPTDPTSLKCAACGCHRNFHRRHHPEDDSCTPLTATIEYQPHHRHHPPPPPPLRSPNSASPPPISSSYAPHMLLALSGGVNENSIVGARKRFRTKFSQGQKEKMYEFAERVGWKMQKKDEELVQGFCNEVGVDKGVFKVWMHNNKNTFGKKSDATDHIVGGDVRNENGNDNGNANGNNGADHQQQQQHEQEQRFENVNVGHVGTNGSSSSS